MLGNWGEPPVVQHHACDVSAVRLGNVGVAWCIFNVLEAHIGVFSLSEASNVDDLEDMSCRKPQLKI